MNFSNSTHFQRHISNLVTSFSFAFVVLFACANASLAQETFLLNIPDEENYQVGYQDSQSGFELLELVPDGQTVDNWREMITIQKYVKGVGIAREVTAIAFAEAMITAAKQTCAECDGRILAQGIVNGRNRIIYAVDFLVGNNGFPPEWVLGFLFEGQHDFSLVLKAWRSKPADSDFAFWRSNFEGAMICENVSDGRVCLD